MNDATPDDVRERLDATQWHVTQEAGTEAPFTGKYWDCHDDGTYTCVVCATPLFRSDTKYESGSGWPSFWEPVSPDALELIEDRTPRHGSGRGAVRNLRCTSRPRLPRRTPADRASATA